jgi:hypothetical protein
MKYGARMQFCAMLLTALVFLDARPMLARSDLPQVHVIELIADKDSRYKSPNGGKPEITLKAGEAVLLRISARKAKSWNRDGSIHGFSLLHAGDRTK